MPSLLQRVCGVVLSVGLVAGTCAALTGEGAAADDYALAGAFVADINQARASAGLAPLSVAGDLTAVAAGHSAAMEASQSLYHNPSLTTQVADWESVGENVGIGPSVSAINTAFLQSPEHRANILDAHYTQVGVAVDVDYRGALWVTEDFRQPMYAAPAPARPAPARPKPVAAPVRSVAAPVRSVAAPVRAATGRPAVRPPAPPRPRAARPSPTAVLAGRLAWVRTHLVKRGADPVAQALRYLKSMSALTASS